MTDEKTVGKKFDIGPVARPNNTDERIEHAVADFMKFLGPYMQQVRDNKAAWINTGMDDVSVINKAFIYIIMDYSQRLKRLEKLLEIQPEHERV
jgi:hypothetical protein